MSRPIFIVGSQRSGTTLLRLLLDSHPNIAIGPESGFMRAVAAIRTIPDWPAKGEGWYESFGVTAEELNARIRSFYHDFFSDYARRQGKGRWGEKTPFHLFHTDEIREIFPEAQFVGIVRHAGAVATSLLKWKREFASSLDYWNAGHQRLSLLRRQGCCHLVRYEDLVMTPEATCRGILEVLGEPWSDAVLQHQEVHRGKGTDQIVDGGTRSTDPVDQSRIDEWRNQVNDIQMELLRTKCQSILTELGYEVGSAFPVAPLSEH